MLSTLCYIFPYISYRCNISALVSKGRYNIYSRSLSTAPIDEFHSEFELVSKQIKVLYPSITFSYAPNSFADEYINARHVRYGAGVVVYAYSLKTSAKAWRPFLRLLICGGMLRLAHKIQYPDQLDDHQQLQIESPLGNMSLDIGTANARYQLPKLDQHPVTTYLQMYGLPIMTCGLVGLSLMVPWMSLPYAYIICGEIFWVAFAVWWYRRLILLQSNRDRVHTIDLQISNIYPGHSSVMANYISYDDSLSRSFNRGLPEILRFTPSVSRRRHHLLTRSHISYSER